MALKKYLDLRGLAQFRNKILADNIINNTYSLVPAGEKNNNLQYYTKSGDTYTAVAIADVPATIPANTYYTINKGSLLDTQHAPSIKGMSTYTEFYVDKVIEEEVGPLIDAKISSVNYGTVTISGTSFTGIYTTNGTTHAVVAVDSTSGGTASSTSLITSGAVNAGLSAKEDVANKVTSLTSSSTDTEYPSAKAVYDALQTAGTVQDVTLNGTSVVSGGVAAITADISAGGTSGSSDLITSGAVNEGLASVSAAKVNKTTTVNGHALSDNVTVTASDVGLGNVENKSSSTIRGEITSSNVTTALGFTPMNAAIKGAVSGVAELDSNGKVPSAQLPSYVDDVVEGYYDETANKFYYDSAKTQEITPESGKIYVDLNTNKTYRWSGSTYVVIGSSLALGETSSTAYRGDRGAAAYAASVTNVDTTPGGTSGSTNLITSGAVNQAFASINAAKEDVANKVTSISSSSTNTQYPSAKAVYDALQTAGTVQDVTLNGTSVVSGGVAAITADTTPGGTSGSTNLITSGAVNEGLVSVSAAKVNKTTTVNGHALSDNVTVTASDVGLGNVGNFKAVSTVASQGLTDTEKSNARDNIGAGLTTIYRVTPSDVTIETDDTKGVSPYSTSYGYTNITINTLNGGAVTALPTIAIGLTLQFECSGVLVVASAYRNVRIRFTSSGSWIPLFANTGIAIGNSFFADGYTRLLTYRTDQYASGAFHAFTDSNTTYSHASLGQGYGTCATAAATAAKVVTFSGYSLTVGGIVAVKFTYAVPASATMNINSRGAKAIYYNGAAITANIINAGDLAYFIYNGSQYHYLGKDSAVSTSITSSSTDRQVPSAKAVYTAISSISSDTIKVAAQSSTMYLVGVPSASAGNQAAQVASSGTTHAYVTTDGYLYADRIYNAVWNDIADFVEVPEGFNVQYGKAYTRDKSGNIVLANNGKALGIASDTYGFGVGNKEGRSQMPIAIGGWVLAYVDKIYDPMTPLKAGKDGVLTELLDEDRDYLCLGFFDRVEPNKEWNGLNVNGRHWIKVK